MKTITAYKTSDGQLFTDEDKAIAHQQDIIGELLEDLVENDDDRENFTRNDRYVVLMKMLKNPKLKEKIANLHKHLSFNDDEE